MLGPCGHSRAPVPWSLGSLCPTEDKVSVTTFVFFIHVNPGFRFSPNNKPTEDKPGFSFTRYELQEHGENPHVRRRPCPQPLPCSAADGLCCGAPARPGPWRGSCPGRGGRGGVLGLGCCAPGSFRPVAAPYLSSGLCSNLWLPHRSHTGQEKAVLSSTATTVPRPRESRASSGSARQPLCAPQDAEGNQGPRIFLSLVSLYKCP